MTPNYTQLCGVGSKEEKRGTGVEREDRRESKGGVGEKWRREERGGREKTKTLD